MQIARVRTPNRLNLVVYVQHSRGIISRDADLRTKPPPPPPTTMEIRFPSSSGSLNTDRRLCLPNYWTASDAKLNFHQLLPYERALIKVKCGGAIVRKLYIYKLPERRRSSSANFTSHLVDFQNVPQLNGYAYHFEQWVLEKVLCNYHNLAMSALTCVCVSNIKTN